MWRYAADIIIRIAPLISPLKIPGCRISDLINIRRARG
jgi:hypothetical protein